MAGSDGPVVLPVVVTVVLVVSFGMTPAAAAIEAPSGESAAGASVATVGGAPSDSEAGAAVSDVEASGGPSDGETADSRVPASTTSPTGTPVSDCTTLDAPGEYHLTGNVTAPANETCIFINSSDVTFDGNGYTVEGNGTGANYGHPILVKNASDAPASPDGYLSNVTVRNVDVANWSQAVRFRQVDDATVENTLIRSSFKISGTSSGTGLRFFKGSNVRVVDSRLTDIAGEGVVVREATRTLVAGTTVENTGEFGILLDGGETHVVRDSSVANASLVGIHTPKQGRTDDVLIENTTVRSSSRAGIRTWATRDSRIVDSTLTGNDGPGIWVSGSYTENVTLRGNTIRANAGIGIILKNLDDTGGSLVADNTVRGNGAAGIIVLSSANAAVRGNVVDGNDDDGLRVGSRNLTVAGNVLTNHTGPDRYGVRLRHDFDGLRLVDNAVCGNTRGLFVRRHSSGVATIEGNTIASNTKDGVLIDHSTPVETITFRNNVIADNGNYGIYSRNEEGVVRATDNWWGSGDGPSSPGSLLEDPLTGALADGSGDNLSENGSNPGVSNVHFDPWLTSEPSVGATCPSPNEPPSVSVDDDSVTVDEGETATNTGTFSDPDGDNVTLTASVGAVTKNPDGTWSWSYQTTDGPDQSGTVTVTATDEEGSTSEVTFDLTVNNVPPSVTADDASVTVPEGQTATNTGTYGDPGNDTVTLSASVGTVTKNPDGTWSWSYATSDGPDDGQTVTITAVDEDGERNETTFDLTVANAPPSVSADDGSVTVDEGETATNTGTFSDPGNDTVSLSASVGTVTKNPDGTWAWSYETTDGPDQSGTVTITATDGDGDVNRTTFDLTVENRPPSVDVDDASVTVPEGQTATNTGTYGDPGNDTVTLSASVGTVTKNPDGTWAWSYDTTGASDRTVTITATDDDGASAQTSFNLTVEDGLEPGEDYTADFKGCSEVWVVFQRASQLPVDATVRVYNAAADAEETVTVRIEPGDVERIPGQYGDRPLYKFNVHDYFDRDGGDDKVLAVSVGGGPVAENPNRCADDTTGDDEKGSGNGKGNSGGGKGSGK